MKKFFAISLILVLVLTGLPVLAQSNPDPANPGQPKTPVSFQLENPLAGVGGLMELLNKIIDFVMLLAIPVIVIMIIWVGLQFVLARGNETEITKAKQMFFWVIIGAVIILSAKLIITIVESTINALK